MKLGYKALYFTTIKIYNLTVKMTQRRFIELQENGVYWFMMA